MKENRRADAKEEKKKNEDEKKISIVLEMEKAEITYCSLTDSSFFEFT